ncbi:unnamed protein product, partial [Mesorhabditis spiculigera]
MRGERLPDGGCACQPYFFGSICQYTSRCDQGHIRHGRCICQKDWGGDYCHLIVCHYGYPDVMNRSRSCICPPKYKGAHCDQCAQVGPKIGVYPKCAVSLIPRHAMARKKTKSQIRSHLVIILGACGFLAVVALAMAYVHYRRKKAKNPEIELARQQELNERAAMLTEQAMRSALPGPQRKRSLLGTFQLRRDFPSERRSSGERRRSLPYPFATRPRRATADD